MGRRSVVLAAQGLLGMHAATAFGRAVAPSSAASTSRSRATARRATRQPDGEAFAGGLAFETAFGTIYSTNITPDAETEHRQVD